jgi:Immunity protein 42
MVIGDPSVFAIESAISQAYDRLSFRGLGYFVIHVKCRRYGVCEPEATMLACSLDAVERRISDRGCHTTAFATELDAAQIADAFRSVFYAEEQSESYFGMPAANFAETISSKHIQWAPDGDEAFDDGSYVLQFDVGGQVRLIAFRCGPDGCHDSSTLSDLWIASDEFYALLRRWRDSFTEDWAALPKVAE